MPAPAPEKTPDAAPPPRWEARARRWLRIAWAALALFALAYLLFLLFGNP